MMTSSPASPQEALAHFSTMIASYEHRVGHVCRAVASHIPQLLSARSLPASPIVLDNACGTGAATEEFLKIFDKARISAADTIPTMVEAFRAVIAASPLLTAQVEDLRLENAQALTYLDNTFDVSITNFGIFFFPDPLEGARHIFRTLKPGGTAVVTVWKTLGFRPILWEAQDRVKPQNPLVELSLTDPWCDPRKLEGVMSEAGFRHHIDMREIKATMWGKDKEDFKTVVVENCSAMVSRNWNDEEKAQLAPVVSDVVDEMHDKFCVEDGEKVGCRMEAWVAVCAK